MLSACATDGNESMTNVFNPSFAVAKAVGTPTLPAPPTTFPWPIVGGMIGAILIAGLVMFFTIGRRRAI